MKTQTPITESAKTKSAKIAGLSAWVLTSDMVKLELAANALQDSVENLLGLVTLLLDPNVGGAVAVAGTDYCVDDAKQKLATFAALKGER